MLHAIYVTLLYVSNYYVILKVDLFFSLNFQVKMLCKQWFPIEYPDIWYEEITSNSKFYALAATYQKKIIGLLVAETKVLNKMNKEVRVNMFL